MHLGKFGAVVHPVLSDSGPSRGSEQSLWVAQISFRVSGSVNMRTLHRLRRLLEGKWFLAEDEFTILKLN